ncbi:unnamed protein product [Lactuca saligna]|uniref:XPC-binding domain-containing protein n=1 Tax=Lactuca saligna TaxID=75948 RepID=A0AA35VC22_LACSI|nr:unnamed protein product [Lactuca saligna]
MEAMSGAKKEFQQWDLFHLMEEMPEEGHFHGHFRNYEVLKSDEDDIDVQEHRSDMEVVKSKALEEKGLPDMDAKGLDGAAGNLDFLRNRPQFQALRAMVQANPQILQVFHKYKS